VTEFFVAAVTLFAIGVCAFVGSRLGGRRFASSAGGLLLALVLGSAVVALGVQLSVYWPFGLLTPAIAGTTCFFIAWFVLTRMLARWLAVDREAPVVGRNRMVGALMGCASGVFVSGSLWVAAMLAEGVWTVRPPEQQVAAEASRGWTHALVKTANRGFVRHLPVIGELGDEVEATVFILNSSERARRHIASSRDLQRLIELPSYKALSEDDEVSQQMEAVRDGSVLALYRLQRNPLVVAFIAEDEVQEMIVGMRPSALAKEIEEYEKALGSERKKPPVPR
jgi:hypothetical protein